MVVVVAVHMDVDDVCRNTVEHELVFFDLYGAQSPQQAAAHLDMAVECAVKTIGSVNQFLQGPHSMDYESFSF